MILPVRDSINTEDSVLLEWEKISTVFLDMDGTLLDLHFDNHFWHEHVPLRFSELHELDIDAAKTDLYARYRSLEGRLEWYCVDYWTRELAMDIVQLKQEVAHLVSVFPFVVDFLSAVQGSGKRLVLLTNAHRRTIEIKFARTGLEPYFDAVISSHDLGLAKEHNEFWQKLSGLEPFDPEHTLFIDDNLRVLNAARAYGVRHLVSIRKPDSRKPEQDTGDYTAIKSFAEIMPSPSAAE